MRAIVIPHTGGPDVLRMVERPDPQAHGAGVRVRVHAAGVNRADLLQRMGRYPAPPGAPADIPGLEYAGVVDAVGPLARERQVGDRVMGLVGGGAYADYVVVHERETIRVPDGMSLENAAAVPEVFMTAHRALVDEGGLRPGDAVLIRPATAGVGIAAVQIAHALGAVTIGTSRSGERLERMRAHGLDHAHQDGSGSLAEAVRGWTGGHGALVLLDLLGGGHLAENLDALRDEGRLVLVGVMAGARDEIDLGRVLQRRLTVRAMTMRSLPLERRITNARDFESRLLRFFENGRLRPVVESVASLGDAGAVHQAMADGGHFGKLVLRMME